MAFSVGLHTLGCKVSQYETEAVAEEFSRRGFAVCPFDSPCDVYVINTCTVTGESDRKSRQMIRRACKNRPGAVVIVMGCSAQRESEAIAAIDGVSAVVGTNGKMDVPALAEELLRKKEATPRICVTPLDGARFEKMTVLHAPRTRAYVKIEDGCECRCAYCAIPSARGPVRSKAPDDVLREVRDLVDGGCREIVLTGIETASYGAEFDSYRLIDLIEALDGMPGLARIRLGSLTPEWMKPNVIERLSRVKTITPHFHLSIQSGSQKILGAMRRRYNAAFALDAIGALREAIPDVMFTSDFIVGFPGETEEDFLESCDFARRARFLQMHVFAYSRRAGTPAATMPDQVPEDVKRDRSARLIALGDALRAEVLDEVVRAKKPLNVLFETEDGGRSFGHSDSFIEVSAEATGIHSKMATVLPLSHDGRVIHSVIQTIQD